MSSHNQPHQEKQQTREKYYIIHVSNSKAVYRWYQKQATFFTWSWNLREVMCDTLLLSSLYWTAACLLALVFLLFSLSLVSFLVSRQVWITGKTTTCFSGSYLQTFHQPICALVLPCLTHHQNSEVIFLSKLFTSNSSFPPRFGIEEKWNKYLHAILAWDMHKLFFNVLSFVFFLLCANNNMLVTHSIFYMLPCT